MLEKRRIFKDISDDKMFEFYNDICNSKELGIRPLRLDKYANQIKKELHYDMLIDASNYVIELFYEELTLRYFKGILKLK